MRNIRLMVATAGTALTVLAASVSIGLAGSQQSTAASKVRVTLKEFTLVPSAKSASAGKVTFAVANKGKMAHELIVIKTNKAPGALPVKNGRASEAGKISAIQSIGPGKTKSLTVTLKKGKYVLICNVPGHYKAGQFAGFVVK